MIARSMKPRSYILKSESESKSPTTFKIKPLANDDRFSCIDLMHSAGMGSYHKAVVLGGLVGWENFNDALGKPIPFKKEQEYCSPENLDYLPTKAVVELAREILKLDNPTEDEIKNSESEGSS